MSQQVEVYVGLGSNLSNPKRQIIKAVTELDSLKHTRLKKVSSLYASKPMGPADQPDYINAVVMLETTLSAESLLDELQNIEQNHRRQRKTQRWGPRTLDLDIILYGSVQMKNKRLEIPHYGVAEREFVLIPLQELQADLIIPGKGSVAELIERLPPFTLKKLENINKLAHE